MLKTTLTYIKKIGIVSLASPLSEVTAMSVQKAIAWLQGRGYEVVVAPSTFKSCSYKSAMKEVRANDLMELFKDPEVDLIWNTTGGYNSNEVLELLDYEVIAKNKKWFVGFSDITALNIALYSRAGIPTVMGPHLAGFICWPEGLQELLTALETPEYLLQNKEQRWQWRDRVNGSDTTFNQSSVKALKEKTSIEAAGVILAANLSTLCLLLGGPYLPSFKGAVLFLEYDKEEGSALPSLERFMWQLRQAGILSQLAGLVFGTLEAEVAEEEKKYRRSIREILSEVTFGYEYPVVYDAQFGHIYPSWILKIGATAMIKVNEERVCIRSLEHSVMKEVS